MKVAAAIAVIIATVLIACSSEPTTLQTQPASTTAPTANPMATAATEAPVEKATTKATPTLEPTEAPTATAPASPTPKPTTPPTDATEPPIATPVPTPTTIHTSEIKLQKVAVAEVPTELPAYDRDDWNHWTDSDDDCQDARQEVLVAESRNTISFKTDRGVASPPANGSLPTPAPSSPTPESSTSTTWCRSATPTPAGLGSGLPSAESSMPNYLDDPQHLIAVTASANRSKGARGPEDVKGGEKMYPAGGPIAWFGCRRSRKMSG